jgi:F-type H+-transporting ATPase subunit gamma
VAKAKELRRRIKGVRNTRKITRTMMLVATAKAKGAQDRVKSVVPYGQTLLGMVSRLVAAGARHPLLAAGGPEAAGEASARRSALFAITANRGLCGGYNANVVRIAREARQADLDAGRAVDLYVSGKKGISTLRFLKVPTAGSYTQFEDRPDFEAVCGVLAPILERFVGRAIDRLEVVSYRYVSAGQQLCRRQTILPITPPPLAAGAGAAIEPLLHPDPQTLLSELLPLVAQVALFQAFVEAAASEQIQRRIAMKNATDSADEMIGNLTREYNRARQAGITQEIAEIVGGAAALE